MSRIVDKLLSGRFIILVTFGLTLCLLANSSLLAIIAMLNYKKDGDIVLAKEILPILKDVLLFLLGAVSSSFNKIWDNYTYRVDRIKPIIENKTEGDKNEKDVINNNGSVTTDDFKG